MEFEGCKRISSELNIAPLVDVVFLLLIFFMLTSTMMKTNTVEVNLPKSSTAVQTNLTPITVTLQSSNKIFVNEQEVPLNALGTLLASKASNPEEPVIIRSDAGVEVQTLISVMDILKTQGLVNISLAAVGGER